MNIKKLFFGLIALVVFVACNKEEVKIDERDDYVGTYSVKENCDGSATNYLMQINKWDEDNLIRIENILNTGNGIFARLRDGQIATFTDADIDFINGYRYRLSGGFGGISNNKLTLHLEIEVRDRDSEPGEPGNAKFACTVEADK